MKVCSISLIFRVFQVSYFGISFDMPETLKITLFISTHELSLCFLVMQLLQLLLGTCVKELQFHQQFLCHLLTFLTNLGTFAKHSQTQNKNDFSIIQNHTLRKISEWYLLSHMNTQQKHFFYRKTLTLTVFKLLQPEPEQGCNMPEHRK